MKKIIDGAMFIAILSAILYSLNTAQYRGFLATLQLDSSMMERSFNQILYNGFMGGYVLLINILIFVCLFLLGWKVFLYFLFNFINGSFRGKRNFIRLKRLTITQETRTKAAVEIRASKWLSRCFSLILLGIGFLIVLWRFEVIGVTNAQELLSKHSSGELENSLMISVKIADQDKELTFLACGSRNCAGMEQVSNKIYYFPQSLGYSSEFVVGD